MRCDIGKFLSFLSLLITSRQLRVGCLKFVGQADHVVVGRLKFLNEPLLSIHLALQGGFFFFQRVQGFSKA